MPFIILTDSQMAIALKEAERRIESSRNQTNRTFTGITVTKELNEKISVTSIVVTHDMFSVKNVADAPWGCAGADQTAPLGYRRRK